MPKFYYLIFMFSVCILALPSCLKKDDNCTVSADCYSQKIDSGDVKIRISYEQGQPGVPVIFYKGYVENQEILWQDTVYQNEVILYMPVGERYAAEVYYNTSNKMIVALDGKKLKNNTHRECGTKCYDFPTVSLDCRKL